MRLAVFTYDFPHRKTQDFLLRLVLYEYEVRQVLIAPFEHLITSYGGFRTKPRHLGALDARDVCCALKLPCCSMSHSSDQAVYELEVSRVDVGIVAGARILKRDIIEACKKGIINIHPGLIPEVRGSDSLKWAVYKGEKLGVTAHFIDERVDAGRIILRREIEVHPDDTWVDLSLRLEEVQPEVLIEALRLVEEKEVEEFPLVGEVGKANSYFPVELEGELDLETWKRRTGCRKL